MVIVGVDPGVSGGVAFIGPDRASVHDMPVLELAAAARAGKSWVPKRIDGRGLAMLVRQHCPADQEFAVFVERVQAIRGSGDSSMQSSMQAEGSLMRSLGAIEAVFDVLRHPAQLVPPQEWQKFFGLVGKKTENQIRPRGELPAAIRKARELYPELEGDLNLVRCHNRAEAVLIAHYAARRLTDT